MSVSSDRHDTHAHIQEQTHHTNRAHAHKRMHSHRQTHTHTHPHTTIEIHRELYIKNSCQDTQRTYCVNYTLSECEKTSHSHTLKQICFNITGFKYQSSPVLGLAQMHASFGEKLTQRTASLKHHF